MNKEKFALLPAGPLNVAAAVLVFGMCWCMAACSDAEDAVIDSVADAAASENSSMSAEDTHNRHESTATEQDQRPPFAEVIDAGLADYLGQAVISEQTINGSVTSSFFTVESGPVCLRGAPYSVSTRPGTTNSLLIFLGGGGACWSDFCAAFDEAPPGIPDGDVLRPDLETNPFREFHMAYLPYCDGSLFGGDAEHDDNGDGEIDRIHAGLRNLSAALDVISAEFPNPDRVVLAGASGGGYGTIVATPLVRVVYPDAPIDVVNDSGPGIARGDSEPDFVGRIISEFGSETIFPKSCEDCLSDGHLTGLIAWSLREDPNLRVAVFSFMRDFVIGTMFLGMGGQEFETYLREEMTELHDAHPERFQYMLASGSSHTGTFGDITVFGGLLPDSFDPNLIDLAGLSDAAVGDITLGDWLHWMQSDDERWTSYAADP